MSVDDAYLSFEAAVMDLLLAGDDPVLEALRAQYEASTVTKQRMFSGVGLMTKFDVPPDLPKVEGKSIFFLSDACADINGVKGIAGFQVQIKSGRLKALEAYTYSEPWPAQILTFDLYYKYPSGTPGDTPERDPRTRLLDQVRRQWQIN